MTCNVTQVESDKSLDSNPPFSDHKLFLFPGRVPGAILQGIFTHVKYFQCPFEGRSTISSFSNEKSEAWKSEETHPKVHSRQVTNLNQSHGF